MGQLQVQVGVVISESEFFLRYARADYGRGRQRKQIEPGASQTEYVGCLAALPYRSVNTYRAGGEAEGESAVMAVCASVPFSFRFID